MTLSLLLALFVAPGASAEDSPGLLQVAEWTGLSSIDNGEPPMVAVDAAARAGMVLSAGASTVDLAGKPTFGFAQSINLDNGRLTSPRVAIPALETRSPVVVDPRRHLLVYAAASVVAGSAKAYAGPPVLIGMSMARTGPRLLFQVPARFPNGRIAGLALSPDGADLVVLSSSALGDTVSAVPAATAATVDWLSLDGLLRGSASSRWSSPYQVPSGTCPELLQVHQPAGVLASPEGITFACRAVSTPVGDSLSSALQPNAVLTLEGASAAQPPTAAVAYPCPGHFGIFGESYADTHTHRMVLIDQSNGGQGARVFDVIHRRFVGMVKAGAGSPSGIAGDPSSGRIYFSGSSPGADLGLFDLAPIVPTQGYLDTMHFGAAIGNTYSMRMTFDPVGHHLLVPRRDYREKTVSVLVVADRVPPVAPSAAPDPDQGALDRPELPGITVSSRSVTAHAYGADYQLIGGTGNLFQNIMGVDAQGVRPESRSLRQAVVSLAFLGDQESSAVATTALQDRATSADRAGVKPETNGVIDAGGSFAPLAGCADFGSSPTKTPVSAFTAQVACDTGRQVTNASASFDAANGLFITTQGQPAPVAAPIQVGSSSVRIVENRAPNLGAAGAVVTARADNIDVLGVVHIGSVQSTLTIATHGRPGTALASPPHVSVSGLSVDGTVLCTFTCPLDQVAAAFNAAFGSRGHIDFPQGRVIKSPRGALASYGQDPWYHAERLLDYDKSDDDYAVPAMTMSIILEGRTKSRLVVDLAGMDAASLYRIYALPADEPFDDSMTGKDDHQVLPRVDLPVTQPVLDRATGQVTAGPAPEVAGQGPLQSLVNSVKFGLRSPRAALPVLMVWALLACAPYLAARRRLLLELPLLSREKDIA